MLFEYISGSAVDNVPIVVPVGNAPAIILLVNDKFVGVSLTFNTIILNVF